MPNTTNAIFYPGGISVSGSDSAPKGLPVIGPPVPAGTYNIPLGAGTLTVIEPVFAERHDSAKFDVGKGGVTAHRTFVVPWKNSVTGKKWSDYVAQLYGKTVIMANPAGGVQVVPTYPDQYHVDQPWLYCTEVSVTGEDQQGPDSTGRIQFRRAILKAKYQPLDFMEKCDVTVQFQPIPGFLWSYIGQDARRSVARRMYRIQANASEGAVLQGQFTLKFVKYVPATGSTNFIAMVGFVSADSAATTTLLASIPPIRTIATNTDAAVEFVDSLDAAVNSLNAIVAQMGIQAGFVSSGTPINDQPLMTAMVSTMFDLWGALDDLSSIMSSIGTVVTDPAQLNTINAAIGSTNTLITTVGADGNNMQELLDNAIWPEGTALNLPDCVVAFDMTKADQQLWKPNILQRHIEDIIGQGLVEVWWNHGTALNYQIVLYTTNVQISLAVDSFNVVEEIPPFRLTPVLDGNGKLLGNYFLVIRGVSAGTTFKFTPRRAVQTINDEGRQSPLVTFALDANALATAMHDAIVQMGLANTVSILSADGSGSCFGILINRDVGVDPSNQSIAVNQVSQNAAQLTILSVAPPPLPPVGGTALAGRYIQLGHYQLEKHQVLAPVLPLLLSLCGTVNSKTFQGFAASTLLLTGLEAKKTRLMDGSEAWTIHFKFGYNPNSWLTVYRGATSQYEFVRAVGQVSNTNQNPQLTIPVDGGPPVVIPAQPTNLILPDGTPIPILTRGAGITVTPPMATNDVQTITMTATGGTWAITFTAANGQTSLAFPLAWNIAPADLQTILTGLAAIGIGNVTVTGAPGSSYVITFVGALSATLIPPLILGVGNLTGGTATIAHTTPGVPALNTAAGQVPPAPSASSVQAVDLGLLYPIADFSIISVFF